MLLKSKELHKLVSVVVSSVHQSINLRITKAVSSARALCFINEKAVLCSLQQKTSFRNVKIFCALLLAICEAAESTNPTTLREQFDDTSFQSNYRRQV